MWLSLILLLPLVQETPADSSAPSPEVQVEAPARSFTPLLHLACEGPEAWLVDAKDRRVLAALQMLDERVLELPSEIPDFGAPPGALQLVLNLLSGPKSLTIGTSSQPIAGLPLPFAGELRLTRGSAEQAGALVAQLAEFMGQFGLPLSAPPEGEAWVLPLPVPLWMGASEGSVFLRLGLEEGVQVPDHSSLLPSAARLSSSGSMDYGALLKFAAPFLGAADPEFGSMLEAFESFGLGDLRFEWATGTDAERSYTVVNMPGWAQSMTESGLMPRNDLDPAILAAIPADATWAVAMAMDLGPAVDAYRELLPKLTDTADLDLEALFSEATGLDLNRDLVALFGKNAAFYASDSTGGGGIFSSVVLLEIADRETFHSTWEKLEAAANGFGASEAKGYLRFTHLEQDGLQISLLSFPGLPVPFEICMAESGRYAVFAVTPQALLGAVDQINGDGSDSLLNDASFQEQLPLNPESGAADLVGAQSVSWVNTPRLMQDGYSLVSLMSSALANLVRSPAGAEREPGILMPSFNELRAGAKPMLGVGRRVGADFRSVTRGDRSLLVNATGITGYLANSPLGPLVAAGVFASLAIPQLTAQKLEAEQAIERVHELELEEEMETELFANIEAIYIALEEYAILNEGRYPDSLLVLTLEDENGHRFMPESLLFDPWGDAYLYEQPTEKNPEPFVTYQE